MRAAYPLKAKLQDCPTGQLTVDYYQTRDLPVSVHEFVDGARGKA